MKKSRKTKRLSPKVRRALILISLLLAIGLLIYAEVVRPNQDAKDYTDRLSGGSQPLQRCFETLAETTQLSSYYAPDIALQTKQQDAATILKQITTCRSELDKFDHTAHQLLNLRLAGYTATYREAKVNQRQAFDVIGQSRDVLNQYNGLASFLQQYYAHVAAFNNYTSSLMNDNPYFGTARLQAMADQANDLRSRADQIRQLAAPAEFDSTKQATSDLLITAADGFDSLITGYRLGNDYAVTTGYANIDQALATYDSTIINLPFDHLTRSYIPKQVEQLPGKVENLLSTSSE